ncbi:hypothetical protein DENSPDRAFT_84361 [Dentipellis sp. KUC8613]|nr:hypothetical protein DENSPDRAFT_84361 [Dentipellis sp. KUC8613]
MRLGVRQVSVSHVRTCHFHTIFALENFSLLLLSTILVLQLSQCTTSVECLLLHVLCCLTPLIYNECVSDIQQAFRLLGFDDWQVRRCLCINIFRIQTTRRVPLWQLPWSPSKRTCDACAPLATHEASAVLYLPECPRLPSTSRTLLQSLNVFCCMIFTPGGIPVALEPPSALLSLAISGGHLRAMSIQHRPLECAIASVR